MSERTPLQIPLRLRYVTLIREWRERNDLAMSEFARQVGVRRQYLWRIENGVSYTLDTLEPMLTQIRGAPYERPLRVLVGERLLKARQSGGWSQEQVSGRCGVSVGHLSRMERGMTNPTLDLLETLVTELGVAGEHVIEGLVGSDLEVRLNAIEESYSRFQTSDAIPSQG